MTNVSNCKIQSKNHPIKINEIGVVDANCVRFFMEFFGIIDLTNNASKKLIDNFIPKNFVPKMSFKEHKKPINLLRFFHRFRFSFL